MVIKEFYSGFHGRSSDLFILRSYGGDWGIERLCVFRAVCEARRLEGNYFRPGADTLLEISSKFRGGSEPNLDFLPLIGLSIHRGTAARS
jgi:hypothetical protein